MSVFLLRGGAEMVGERTHLDIIGSRTLSLQYSLLAVAAYIEKGCSYVFK